MRALASIEGCLVQFFLGIMDIRLELRKLGSLEGKLVLHRDCFEKLFHYVAIKILKMQNSNCVNRIGIGAYFCPLRAPE